ncbi:hypothetical protein P4534_18340 [Peribacillus butanolivorans]|uniref:hypothetical protein n=1 Tax=Peribacillus butanolivorans TaxID=421767 RepID=UPI002E24563D|nr:hypothetical protein [Peribacillus butanolivorans]
MKKYKNNTTGYTGITLTKQGTYLAKLTYRGKPIIQKRFKTIDQAKNYLDQAKKAF